MNLDIEQKQAVEALGKNILVSASAGAGIGCHARADVCVSCRSSGQRSRRGRASDEGYARFACF